MNRMDKKITKYNGTVEAGNIDYLKNTETEIDSKPRETESNE